jgi:Na+-driven multidrug efflux pump
LKKYWSLLKEAIQGESYDYTTGSINKAIFLLAIPMILELSLEGVFALVDIFFVGKLGSNAIAVVGFTESVMTLVYSVSIGLSTAAAAIIARRVGEKNPGEAGTAAAQSMIFGFIVSFYVLDIFCIRHLPDLWVAQQNRKDSLYSNYVYRQFGYCFLVFNQWNISRSWQCSNCHAKSLACQFN